MPESPPRTMRLCEHIDDVDAAVLRAVEVVCEAIADTTITPEERRDMLAAFQSVRRRLRVVARDGERVNAGRAMISALAHTMELTPSVTRKLRELESDMKRIDKLVSIDDPAEVFPIQAA